MITVKAIIKIFLTFLLVKEIVEIYLANRNRKHILQHKNSVPKTFEEKITLKDHQKAATYSVAKIKVGQFFQFFDFIILLVWTLGGGLEALDKLVHLLNLGPLTSGLVFFLSFGFIGMFLNLPQSIYFTFVVEERFGFNKTSVKTFIMDRVKGIIIGLILGVPLILLILWIMEKSGSNWWLLAWLLLTAFQFTLIWAYPTLIAPLFNKFKPLEEGDVKERILQLLERIGFKNNGLFVMDASKRSAHGNAYFTGLGKNKRIVFFDTLLESLEAEEVEAVLAHELGHFKMKHIFKSLVLSTVMSLLGFAILGQLYQSEIFFQGHGVTTISNYMAIILFSMVSGIYTFLLTPIFSWLSRKNEFQADQFAAKHSSAQKLISALIKMYVDNASTLTPDPLFSKFYHSHPPALTRVNFLENCQSEKTES